MYNFGTKSQERLETCHADIQTILNAAIKLYDFSVIYGIRTTEEQQELYREGKSTLDGVKVKSKHQGRKDENGDIVSYAADLMPYKKGTNAFSGKEVDTRRFYFLMGLIRAVSDRLLEEGKITHKVRFGLDWDSDDVYDDQHFNDIDHMELIPA